MAPTTARFSQLNRVTTLTDASIISIDSNTTIIGVLPSLSQACTFQTPTGNPTEGQSLQIRITSSLQRSISFDSGYSTSSNNAIPTLTTGLNKEDYLFFIYNATDNKWNYINSSIQPTNSSSSGISEELAIAYSIAL
jgi:hypothetical protein